MPARPLAPPRPPPKPRPTAAPTRPAKPGDADLVLFVSSVEGKPVTRLGKGVLIGCRREKGAYIFDTVAVIAITQAEVELYGRVYERTIKEGALVRRTRADFDAYQAKIRERESALHKKSAAPAASAPAAPAGGQ